MDYLDWQSDLSLEQVFADTSAFSYPSLLNGVGTLYLSKDNQDNRSILMLSTDVGLRCLTPAPFSLRTRVNEYGGKPYWVFGTSIVFANEGDQCLYRIDFSSSETIKSERISPIPTDQRCFMYTDVIALGENTYVAIVELSDSGKRNSENIMFVAAIGPNPDDELIQLNVGDEFRTADFISNLCISPHGDRVAWVQWDHPNMPWDGTQVWTADVEWKLSRPYFSSPQQIDVGIPDLREPSVCQLQFADDARLFLSIDYSRGEITEGDAPFRQSRNYWNIYVYDFAHHTLDQVTDDQREYGYPHWVYGDHRIVKLDETSIVTISSAPSGDQLMLIDLNSLEYRPLELGFGACTIQHLSTDEAGSCVAEILPFNAPACLVKLKFQADREPDIFKLVESDKYDLETSVAESIKYPTRDGEYAYGFFYSPSNSALLEKTETNALPPLIVMVHGGPTARAYAHFDLQKQFWTSRGFAILDVNHRGSSGYGRQFRDSLYGQWGERDVADIVDGVQHLINLERVDSKRVCIRGKSAGGYAVLRALTEYPEMFRVGACYYGIGNLVTLAEATHRFEKHYTDRLVGEVFDGHSARQPESNFYRRSPINKMNMLDSAMIVFQGQADRVVPPSVGREIIEVLASAGVDHQYVEYENEGHGFKHPKNNIDAWRKELEFYRRVLRRTRL